MGVVDSKVAALKPGEAVTGVETARGQLGAAAGAQAEELLAAYDVARRHLLALNEEPDEEIPDQVAGFARDWADQMISAIKTFEEFVDRSPQEALNELSVVGGASQEVLKQLRPHIKGGSVAWSAEITRAREVLRAAEMARSEVEELAVITKEIAERTGTGQLAAFYATEARAHASAATGWLISSAVLLAGLIGVGFWLYTGTPVNGPWQEYATAVGAKVFVVGAISYGMVFTTRAYRNNKHLQAVYRQRSAALDTYTLMSKSLTDEQARGIVLSKLAEAVFSPSDTGMAVSGNGDKTIIETTVPLLGALQSPQR